MRNALEGREGRYSIFRLTEALTCWPAVSVMVASYLAAALLLAVAGMLAQVSMVFVGVMALLAVLTAAAGSSAAGVCLTDLARERPYRSMVGYFVAGLLSLPRLLGAALMMMLAYLGLLLAAALVLLVCKLPGVGPLLLVAVVPALVAVMALALIGYYVTISIVGPALWDGERVMHSLFIAWTITRRHPFAAIGKIVGGLLFSGILASLFIGLLTLASLMVAGLALPILGVPAEMNWPLMMSGMGYAHMGGHMVGAAVGYALVYAVAMALIVLLPLMVGVLTWCEFSEKVDLEGIRSSSDAALKDAQARMADLKDKAQAAAAPASPSVAPAASTMAGAGMVTHATAEAPAASAPPAPSSSAHSCPRCSGLVHSEDRFCEHCGHPLR